MSIEQLIIDHAAPTLDLTHDQTSICAFMMRNHHSAIVAPRAAGLTTSLIVYLSFMLGNSTNNDFVVIFPSEGMRRTFLSMVYNIVCNTQTSTKSINGRLIHDHNNVTVSFVTLDKFDDEMRGKPPCNIIFDDWLGTGMYSDKLESKINEFSPLLKQCRVTIAGTTNRPFVYDTHSQSNLMQAILNGASPFKLWGNLDLTELLDM